MPEPRAPALPPLTAAFSYLNRGWAVFPVHTAVEGRCSCGEDCGSPAKHPRTRHGLVDAAKVDDAAKQWWRRWPDANVAIATGAVSGLVVLDIDGHKGGEASLSELEARYGKLPHTPRVITGGDGFHVYFAHPGLNCPNTASRLGPGIDTRGDGGYVVAPPSTHVSGRRYEWLIFDAPLAPLPSWMLEQLKEKPAPPPAPAGPVRRLDAGGTAYGLAALATEVREVRSSVEGTRNRTLNDAAYTLGQLVAGGELEEAVVRTELGGAAAGVGLTDREIERTLASGLSAGKALPRSAPPRPDRPRLTVVEAAAGELPPGEPPEDWEPDDAGSGPGGPSMPADGEPPPIHYTDLGNARRLVAAHGHDLRYCHPWSSWLVWDGKRWQRDATAEVLLRAKGVVDQLYFDALRLVDPDEKKALVKHALASEGDRALKAMVNLAASEPGIPALPERLDAKPWLLNCPNGTLDLRKGELRAHRRSDGLTKMCGTPYDPEATAPRWEAFLTRVLVDPETIAFVQRAVGYSLTGDVSEHKLFFCAGDGANGKGTLLTTMQAVMGQYAMQCEADLLLARYGEVHTTGQLDLMGHRLAVTSEVDQGRRFNEPLVKRLTGGDVIKARGMRENNTEFFPSHKFWVQGNYRPDIRGTDEGIWRRMCIVPFDVKIPEAERDLHLGEHLVANEPAGILAWAVRGCLAWQRQGLGTPAAVVDATADYRLEQDAIGQFLEDRCETGPDLWVSAADLRKEYVEWCESIGERPQSAKAVGAALSRRGLKRAHQGHPRVWTWLGLGVSVRPLRPLQTGLLDERSRARVETSTANRGRNGSQGSPGGDWTYAETPVGECVVCTKSCMSTDPEGRMRHPDCATPTPQQSMPDPNEDF